MTAHATPDASARAEAHAARLDRLAEVAADAAAVDAELARLAHIGISRLGITKIRLTGGEPLVRRDLEEVVAAIAGPPDGVSGPAHQR